MPAERYDEQHRDPEDRDGRGGSFSVGDRVGRGRRAGALAIGVLALSARATRWDLGAGWQVGGAPPRDGGRGFACPGCGSVIRRVLLRDLSVGLQPTQDVLSGRLRLLEDCR